MKGIMFYIMIFVVSLSYVSAGTVDEMMDSCEKGKMVECYKAGMAYWKGEGIEQNREVAKSILKIACESGIKEACVKVKELAKQSDNTLVNPQESTMSIGKAVENSDYTNTNSTNQSYSQLDYKHHNSSKGYGNRFSTYSNARFGFSIRYPSDLFTQKRFSDNGDGVILQNRDGQVELRAYGSFYGDNIRSNYKEEINWIKDDGGQVTYKVLHRTWYVLSGYEEGGRKIFYQKTYFKNGKSKSFKLTYPTAKKRYYNKLVKMISRGFRR